MLFPAAQAQPIQLTQIRKCLHAFHARELEREERRHAAVAMLLRQGSSGPEVLFIERARHPGDPWSGNLAFPGGKISRRDCGPQSAAQRETLEEIGLDLSRVECLGRLNDITGAYLPVLVSCFVYLLQHSPVLTPNEEVAGCFWFPLNHLLQPERHKLASLEWHGKRRRVAAIDLQQEGRPVLWGITYRLILQFLEVLGHRLNTEEQGMRR